MRSDPRNARVADDLRPFVDFRRHQRAHFVWRTAADFAAGPDTVQSPDADARVWLRELSPEATDALRTLAPDLWAEASANGPSRIYQLQVTRATMAIRPSSTTRAPATTERGREGSSRIPARNSASEAR